MEHIQQEFEGSEIQRWELDHGVVRVVRGGCEYVLCTSMEKFAAKCEADKRERRGQMIADAQEAAYLGGGC